MSSEWRCSVSSTEGSWTGSESVSEKSELGDDHFIDASGDHGSRKIAKDILNLQTKLGSEPDQYSGKKYIAMADSLMVSEYLQSDNKALVM